MCHMLHVTYYVSRVTCHILRVTCHTSHIACHMSHVTYYMSHVTPNLSQKSHDPWVMDSTSMYHPWVMGNIYIIQHCMAHGSWATKASYNDACPMGHGWYINVPPMGHGQ